jgi:hypothetical protein
MFNIIVINRYAPRPLGHVEYIGRGSPLGNPYILNRDGTRDEVCDMYYRYIHRHILLGNKLIIDELKRLKAIAEQEPLFLECFCKPKRCHGDIVKKIICEEI